MFQKENAVLRSDFLDFRLQRGCDLRCRFVRNNSDALGSLQPETDADGIACAGGQFGVNGVSGQSIRHKRLKLLGNVRRATRLHLKNERADRSCHAVRQCLHG